MMKMTVAAGLALSILLAPASAETFRAANHMKVTPQGDGGFVVSGNPELFAKDYWCAAGDYALRELRLPVTDRIVVTEPYVRGQRFVGFAADPDAEPQFQIVVLGLSIRQAGASLSVGQAQGFCAEYKLRNRW